MNKRRNLLLSIVIIILVITTIVIAYHYIVGNILTPKYVHNVGVNKFKIKEIYPTKQGGREWYINMDNPKADPIFTIVSNIPITRNGDDNSWFIANSAIRMSVITPPGAGAWKNVEMTGYLKVASIASTTSIFGSNNNNNEESASISDIDWRARGGRHNSNVPCEGTALNGGMYTNGTVAWKKEIWHTGGYTDARGTGKATNSILDRWIGWKVVMYNINNGNQAVKMESYLDDKDNNNWRKVNDVVDNGGWYAKSSDKVFYSADCGRPKDYIITNGGPIATFRADNVAMYFKDLSIREIQPPTS
ncbi:MAG TPA: hypothetical protein VFI70_13710 [Nitrososphaeraceae archaeon]|nr:hypothetical protein [Nitrososphaeraceae archaeon]